MSTGEASPIFMIAPFPNCRSIWLTAASRASSFFSMIITFLAALRAETQGDKVYVPVPTDIPYGTNTRSIGES